MDLYKDALGYYLWMEYLETNHKAGTPLIETENHARQLGRIVAALYALGLGDQAAENLEEQKKTSLCRLIWKRFSFRFTGISLTARPATDCISESGTFRTAL